MQQITLHIDGMMCGMCEAHVNDAVRKAFPVKKVKSSHSAGTCVILSEQDIDLTKLQDVVNATGYTVTRRRSGPPTRKRDSFTAINALSAFRLCRNADFPR